MAFASHSDSNNDDRAASLRRMLARLRMLSSRSRR
jgi:hypothetical protein